MRYNFSVNIKNSNIYYYESKAFNILVVYDRRNWIGRQHDKEDVSVVIRQDIIV